ncbi:MAG: nucleoside kinase [Oscillospiraceae bacterium]|nr:nucleoside kinase [Oscillospiraceae bacterium]
MNFELSYINERARGDAFGFAEECEAVFETKTAEAAAQIAQHLRVSPVVLLAGPSGSGKTTTAKKLSDKLELLGVRAHTVSLDNYFLTVQPETAPRTPEGEIDYESPAGMDMELLDAHFTRLGRGQGIQVPHFSFSQQSRVENETEPLTLGKNEVAIFEGIHALSDRLAGRHPEAFGLYISARSDVSDRGVPVYRGTWTRLTRRIIRDSLFRGTGADSTLAMWANIRRGEKMYISPYKHRAHLLLDSAMPYELAVLKRFAEPLLRSIPLGIARHAELSAFAPSLSRFADIDAAVVPAFSILREFIGGSGFKY